MRLAKHKLLYSALLLVFVLATPGQAEFKKTSESSCLYLLEKNISLPESTLARAVSDFIYQSVVQTFPNPRLANAAQYMLELQRSLQSGKIKVRFSKELKQTPFLFEIDNTIENERLRSSVKALVVSAPFAEKLARANLAVQAMGSELQFAQLIEKQDMEAWLTALAPAFLSNAYTEHMVKADALLLWNKIQTSRNWISAYHSSEGPEQSPFEAAKATWTALTSENPTNSLQKIRSELGLFHEQAISKHASRLELDLSKIEAHDRLYDPKLTVEILVAEHKFKESFGELGRRAVNFAVAQELAATNKKKRFKLMTERAQMQFQVYYIVLRQKLFPFKLDL